MYCIYNADRRKYLSVFYIGLIDWSSDDRDGYVFESMEGAEEIIKFFRLQNCEIVDCEAGESD